MTDVAFQDAEAGKWIDADPDEAVVVRPSKPMFPNANVAVIAAAITAAGTKYAPARGEDDAKTAIRICNFAASILNEVETRMPKPDRMAAARAAKAAKAETGD